MDHRPATNATGLAVNTARHVGRHNRRVLLHALRVHGSSSRAELARFTGLTPQAIANIVDNLIDAGLVREAGRRKSARGQPPIAIEIANDGGYALGVRIDETSFNAVASDLGGELIEMREGPVPRDLGPDWLDFVTEIHAGLTARFKTRRCLGIGLVTPGPFDIAWPGVPTPGAIPQLQNRGITGQLAARTETEVFLENDAFAAALGEKLYGCAIDLTDFFYVYVGEGVGGGIVIRGEPYRGNRGNAGEFGHVIVDPEGPQCYCGNRGCLGEYLSLGSKRRALDAGAQSGTDPDETLDRWIQQASEALSVGIAGIENLFDPQMVVVGGAAPVTLLDRLARGVGDL
ncbi:MAG: ROK family transcriptional regulator, partial [Hyphomicrobiales bacterium]|nr:ROK family transcriptional regulator [Hyphomicrobiales bacterium]